MTITQRYIENYNYSILKFLEVKKGTSLLFLDLSQEVNLLVRQPNRFLEDLRKINQLKDSPFQSDLEDNQPKPKQPQNPTKVGQTKMRF